MRIVPEIELPDELEMAYKPDLKDWVEDNLEGLRRINIQLYIKRNQYDNVAAIEFFEKSQKNSPKEKPKHDGKDIRPDDICELIMKIIRSNISITAIRLFSGAFCDTGLSRNTMKFQIF